MHLHVRRRLGFQDVYISTCAGTPGEQDVCIFMYVGLPGEQDVCILTFIFI